MLNRVTGLSPLEILPGTCSDHQDLLCTHVWGCPVFVLDPKLQDGKKIPKWNKRSRIGQFLGFSDEHSSLVANIRHLKTGHVSPQFHCVFDDLFHTVFSTGENDPVTDAITNLLWDSSREVFAEDEYDEDGLLVYQPPPLDKVWLSEEERRDAKERRLRQRERQIQREKSIEEQILDKVPKEATPTPPSPCRHPRNDRIPDLVEDDASSSDDDSLTDSNKLGTSQESEGEMWSDHPDLDVIPAPEQPSSPVLQPAK